MRKKYLLPLFLTFTLVGCCKHKAREIVVTPTPYLTEVPSATPSQAMTTTPTYGPTLIPAEDRIISPTVIPAEDRTVTPTVTPFEAPTNAPTVTPTEGPTEVPAETPTEAPSDVPPWTPTAPPEDVPPWTPTAPPEDVPPWTPTAPPEDDPSWTPTAPPEDVPPWTPTAPPEDDPSWIPTAPPVETPTQAPTKAPTKVPTQKPTKVPTEAPEEDPETWDITDWATHEAINIINEDRHMGTESADRYMAPANWKALSKERLAVYRELEDRVSRFEPFTYEVAEYGYEYLDNVYAVLDTLQNDRMDLDIYFNTDEEFDEDGMQTALKSRYIYPYDSSESAEDDLEGVREAVMIFEDAVDRIIARMPADYSDYDKYRYLATVISLTTSYDYYGWGGYQVGNAYGAIYGGWSICEGYSTGFKYLCSRADLYCTRASGYCPGEEWDESHMWNRVKLDGQDYYIDVTWCDTNDQYPASDEWKRYFMVSQTFLEEEANHVFETMDE